MYGMSVREVLGRANLTPFIDRVIDAGPGAVTAPDEALNIRDYLDLMLAGSFPEPSLRIPVTARRPGGQHGRHRGQSTLWSAAGINAKPAQSYQALFQRMFVLDLVPAWFSNRIKRLVKAPKRYLVDPALVAAVLGLGRDAIRYGPDMLGRLLVLGIAREHPGVGGAQAT